MNDEPEVTGRLAPVHTRPQQCRLLPFHLHTYWPPVVVAYLQSRPLVRNSNNISRVLMRWPVGWDDSNKAK